MIEPAEKLSGEYTPYKPDDNPTIQFGQYLMFDVDDKSFGIAHPSGECGVFSKDDFESHLAAVFGLNF